MKVDDILKNHEKRGVDLTKLTLGTTLLVQTQKTLYTLVATPNGKFLATDDGDRFERPKEIVIHGSTWGGSMLKQNWVGIGMHLEMEHPDPAKVSLVTSSVKGIKIIGPEGTWEYEL